MNHHTKALRVCIFLSMLLLLLLPGCANQSLETPPPAEATRDPNLERSIEQQLQEMNAEAVPVYREATTALDEDEYATAKALYERVITMAPEFATAYRRLGYIELNNNNLKQAEAFSRKAVALEPNAYNQGALAMVLLQKDTAQDRQEAYELATSATQSLPDDSQALTALMMAAGATNRLDIARTTSVHLLEVEPTNPLGHYFAGLFAAQDGKWEKAEAELLYAQRLGMPAEAIQEIMDLGVARNALIVRSLREGAIATGVWLLGLGVLFGIGTLLSRATMRAVHAMTPTADFQISPGERSLRSVYKFVITILSLFFYVSIPFAIVVLLLAVGGIFYLFFLIGQIPIQLAVILVVLLLATLVAVAKSLVWQWKDVPPGRELKQIEAPQLWALVEDVAYRLKVKSVSTIYVTPHAEIAVYEKGGILQKLRGVGQRNLILGMGALSGLTQGQLTTILAHEYGHFSNRDTAGGDLAHQVYASLHQMAQRLIEAGGAHMFNPVWLFLVGYQRIFLRITLGASRLQEVLADRYAAIAYGSQNCIEGLNSVTRQGIAFDLHANYEIRKSFELNRPISNIYNLPFEERLQGELEKQIQETMERRTSPYDSHPAPKDRIELIERLHVPYSVMQDNQRPALQLFPNAEELQREVTAQLMINIRKQNS